jgi:membrane-associated PAP2 superfamily phosphatase
MKESARPWRWLIGSLAMLAVSFAFFEFTDTDIVVQDRFLNFATGEWRVDASDPLGRALFYNGPKFLIIAGAVAMLMLASGPAAWREAADVDRRGLALALLTLASVPLLVGAGKATTNVFCPSEIRRYGGDVGYVKVLERFPDDDRPSRKGHGFPAGHSSGGFALFGLLWLRRGRAWRAAVVALAVAVGWWMGAYQMMKGAHYLSHTVFTMLFALCIALAWRCVSPAHSAGGH